MSGLKSKRKGCEWRIFPLQPIYEISEYGDVRRAIDGVTRRKGHKLQGCYGANGYRIYKLMQPDGTKKIWTAHRLVALTFLGQPPTSTHEVAHWDGNTTNDHFTNLRWATRKENNSDRKRHLTDAAGERNGRALLTEAQVRELRSSFASGSTVKELCRKYGMTDSGIRGITSGRNWANVRT